MSETPGAALLERVRSGAAGSCGYSVPTSYVFASVAAIMAPTLIAVGILNPGQVRRPCQSVWSWALSAHRWQTVVLMCVPLGIAVFDFASDVAVGVNFALRANSGALPLGERRFFALSAHVALLAIGLQTTLSLSATRFPSSTAAYHAHVMSGFLCCVAQVVFFGLQVYTLVGGEGAAAAPCGDGGAACFQLAWLSSVTVAVAVAAWNFVGKLWLCGAMWRFATLPFAPFCGSVGERTVCFGVALFFLWPALAALSALWVCACLLGWAALAASLTMCLANAEDSVEVKDTVSSLAAGVDADVAYPVNLTRCLAVVHMVESVPMTVLQVLHLARSLRAGATACSQLGWLQYMSLVTSMWLATGSFLLKFYLGKSLFGVFKDWRSGGGGGGSGSGKQADARQARRQDE